jgi:hypothetical protein
MVTMMVKHSQMAIATATPKDSRMAMHSPTDSSSAMQMGLPRDLRMRSATVMVTHSETRMDSRSPMG